MYSFYNVVIVVIAAVSIIAHMVFAASDAVNHQANYNKINDYLEDKLGKSSDDNEAMVIASDWLKSLQERNPKSLTQSLRLFVSLNELIEPSSCNERGYKILFENNRALTGLARYGIRVIDRVALDYAQKHANVCCGKYKENYNRKKLQVDTNHLHLVRSFAEAITKYALGRDDYPNSFGAENLEQVLISSPINYIRLMDDGQDRRRNLDSEALVLREYLRDIMGDEILTKKSVGEAYTKYLETPCQKYVDTIGHDVFEPVVLDEITRLDSGGKVAACNEGSMEYHLGLAYYKVCQMYILGKGNLLSRVILNVN